MNKVPACRYVMSLTRRHNVMLVDSNIQVISIPLASKLSQAPKVNVNLSDAFGTLQTSVMDVSAMSKTDVDYRMPECNDSSL